MGSKHDVPLVKSLALIVAVNNSIDNRFENCLSKAETLESHLDDKRNRLA